jgi:hypothetical protein
MNKVIFYILILFIAFSITLVGVYFLNLSNLTEAPQAVSNQIIEFVNDKNLDINFDSNATSNQDNNFSETSFEDLTVTQDYQDIDLTNLEQELNSLDLSSQIDIE